MCWSETASIGMVGLGVAAVVVAARRGETPAIPVTLGFFTIIEALQVAGYQVLDQCGTPENQAVTMLSYLHIALQPIFINAFAMATAPGPVSPRMRRVVYVVAGTLSALLLVRLVPWDWAGSCQPGRVLCGPAWCTISGNWHLGWQVPLNNMWNELTGLYIRQFQLFDYQLAAFVLPLIYGAWRLVVLNVAAGPVLSTFLTDNPNEMPAIWCLFSICIILVSLSPVLRQRLLGSQVPATV